MHLCAVLLHQYRKLFHCQYYFYLASISVIDSLFTEQTSDLFSVASGSSVVTSIKNADFLGMAGQEIH